jgi:hypothetical protein
MENKIKLQFKYSLELETERVLNTIKKWDWYKEHDYWPRLPEKMDAKKVKELSNVEIRKIVSEEYSKDFFIPVCVNIEKEWQKFSDLEKKICLIGFKTQKSYIIQLTKYGMSGSYGTPNKIILSALRAEPVPVLIHEIVHLLIENLIKKYMIKQFVKERIVDLTVARLYPELKHMQNQLTEVENNKIDAIFNMFYPNVCEVIKQVSVLNNEKVKVKSKSRTEEKQEHYRNYINR